jgi:hypothetical protein
VDTERGYMIELLRGWRLVVYPLDGGTAAWLTNDRLDTGFYESDLAGETLLDLEALDYVPSVYHEGVEAPPLVLFHAARADLPAWVWEPASGRLYQAGSAGDA